MHVLPSIAVTARNVLPVVDGTTTIVQVAPPGSKAEAKMREMKIGEKVPCVAATMVFGDDLQLIGGIQSGMGYLGAANLAQLREKARFIRVSPAGQREASPHDVVELKATTS